jgi:hypothetical protein
MSRFSLELSDGIEELERQFKDYTHEAKVLDPADAIALIACCALLKRRARQLENEVSRKRWNDQARAERDEETRRVLDAVTEPGSNVALFPVVPRPFSDGYGGHSA